MAEALTYDPMQGSKGTVELTLESLARPAMNPLRAAGGVFRRQYGDSRFCECCRETANESFSH